MPVSTDNLVQKSYLMPQLGPAKYWHFSVSEKWSAGVETLTKCEKYSVIYRIERKNSKNERRPDDKQYILVLSLIKFSFSGITFPSNDIVTSIQV